MDRNLKAAIVCFLIAGLAFWLLLMQGCAGEHFYRGVVLDKVNIVVVSSDRKGGMAFKEKDQSTIIVTGTIVDGKIVPDADVLAEEVMHLMNFEDPVFRNPDERRLF